MLALGSDHAGFSLKRDIILFLDSNAIAYNDFGTYSPESCDYPLYAKLVAQAVADGRCDKGILVCGTGIGISIAANKIHGIRCSLCSDCFSAEMSRKHNNANILALGARVTAPGLALKILETWLSTDFEGGKHLDRLNLISALEHIDYSDC